MLELRASPLLPQPTIIITLTEWKKCIQRALHPSLYHPTELPVQSMDHNYANQAWLVVWASDFISPAYVRRWLCVPAVCACHSHRGVCARVCALFWLRGCRCCPIMSSIISPVNTAKSSCPWEKLWKGECQYWQTNKFWQRGDFWAIGQGYRHGPVGMSCKDMVCFSFSLLDMWYIAMFIQWNISK